MNLIQAGFLRLDNDWKSCLIKNAGLCYHNKPSIFLAFHHLECLRQNFKIYLVQVASKTCVNLAVSVYVKREVGGEFECFEFAHLDLFETHVCAFEEFGHEAEHGGARKFGDREKFHFAIAVF